MATRSRTRIYSIAVVNIIRQCLFFSEDHNVNDILTFTPRKHQRYTRQSDNLDLAAPRTDFMKHSLSYHGSMLWNSLPSRIRNGSELELTRAPLTSAEQRAPLGGGGILAP